MTNEAMSPLRRRMIEDMTIRKLAPSRLWSEGRAGLKAPFRRNTPPSVRRIRAGFLANVSGRLSEFDGRDGPVPFVSPD